MKYDVTIIGGKKMENNNRLNSNDIDQILKKQKEIEERKLIEEYPEDYKNYLKTKENIENLNKKLYDLKIQEEMAATNIGSVNEYRKEYNSVHLYKLDKIEEEIALIKIQQEINATEKQIQIYNLNLLSNNKFNINKQKINFHDVSLYSRKNEVLRDELCIEEYRYDLDILALEGEKNSLEERLGMITTGEYKEKRTKIEEELKATKETLEIWISSLRKNQKVYNVSVIDKLKRDNIIEDDYYNLLLDRNHNDENINKEISELLQRDLVKNTKVM